MPKASLTGACGLTEVENGLAEVLIDKARMEDILVKMGSNLRLAPTDLALISLEIRLATKDGQGFLLKQALQLKRTDLILPSSIALLIWDYSL